MKSANKFIGIAMCLLAGIFLMTPISAQGQILKRITQKVAEKVESEANKRVEKKIDQSVDKGFDKLEEAAANAMKSADSSGMPSMEAIMAGFGGSEVALKESYNYKLGVTYKVITPQVKENSETEMTMWFSDNNGMAIQANDRGNSMTTVLDGEQFIMFLDQEKTYIAVGPAMMERMGAMTGVGEIEEPEPEEAEEYKITQLPDERVLGYNCKVYRMDGPDNTSKVWLTEQLDASMIESFGNQLGSLTKKAQYKLPPEAKMLQGIMLKNESLDKNSNETTIMEATAIHENGMSIRSADYKPMGG